MRLISLVITLLIIAFLMYKQLGGSEQTASNHVPSTSDSAPLKVPTHPDGIKKFEKDLDKFVKDQADETARRIEEATK